MTIILKFVRECTSILATQVDSPSLALRLFLLAAQIASECGSGFEDLAYDFYVQAFSVYEDSISESRAQLAAITLIIGTLQGARVFEVDGYDTLITKAALHGAKLLKKPHQATAVHAASHLWWQEPALEEVEGEAGSESKEGGKDKDEGEGAKAVSLFLSDMSSTDVVFFAPSIRTRIANACSNASRNRSVSRIRRRRKSSPFRSTVTPSTNICITLSVGHPRCVSRLVFFSQHAHARTLGCPQIHRLPRRTHHLVDRHHHLARVLVVLPPPLPTHRRRRLA